MEKEKLDLLDWVKILGCILVILGIVFIWGIAFEDNRINKDSEKSDLGTLTCGPRDSEFIADPNFDSKRINKLYDEINLLKDYLGVVKITEPSQPEKIYFTDDKDKVKWVKECASGFYWYEKPAETQYNECERLKSKLGL